MDDNLNQNIAPVTEPAIANPVVQSPTPAPKSNRLLFILIFFLALILGSGGTYLVLNSKNQKTSPEITPVPTKIVQLSPTPDLYTEGTRSATANWKTYTNTKYRYSIKYTPQGKVWVLGDQSISIDQAQEIQITFGEIQGYVAIRYKSNPQTLISQQWAEEFLSKNRNIEVLNKGNLSISNLIGYQVTIRGPEGPYKNIYLSKGTNLFEIYTSSINTENQKLLDQILSTFKFTK